MPSFGSMARSSIVSHFGCSVPASEQRQHWCAVQKLLSERWLIDFAQQAPRSRGNALDSVYAPTLLIVGGADFDVIELDRAGGLAQLPGAKALEIVPGELRCS